MAIDRILYKSKTEISLAGWRCSQCDFGKLIFVDKEMRSKPAMSFYSDPISTFSIIATCSQCENPTCFIGTTAPQQIKRMDGSVGGWIDLHDILIAYPALNIIPLYNEYPIEIREELTKAFFCFKVDPHGSVNHVRKALELLLNEQGVKRRVKQKQKQTVCPHCKKVNLGKPQKGYHHLALDHRIKHHWKNPNVNLAEALKIIGNEGSHSAGSVTTEDVYDALDIFEHILEEVYRNKTTMLKKLTKDILKRKRTRSSKKN